MPDNVRALWCLFRMYLFYESLVTYGDIGHVVRCYVSDSNISWSPPGGFFGMRG